ncbi:Hypothetical protein GLP15_407 [Giardia lamblia P15]|uniref:Uncharacterized protein n=1 Tax=Giardia intestinalis (strain P15) TaxID=658858 RepID=E1EXF4_GIAIA|nr:Hypothetical protein GLP15_407 [Giardia lamblia P15]
MKDIITEALNLVDISVRDSDNPLDGGAETAGAYRVESAIQDVLDKTLDRLMHVEKRASAAEAENNLMKQEHERLSAHQRQQDNLLENIQRLYREARDCSDRNAASAKEWRARAHELEAELATKKSVSGDQEKIMQRLRALYIRYTELAVRMKERDTELRAKDELHRAELMTQKSLAAERIKSLEQEITALKRQVELLKKLERSPGGSLLDPHGHHLRKPQTPPLSLTRDRSLREDSDQGVGTIFVRRPLLQADPPQQSDKTMGSSSTVDDIDLQTMQKIQETMNKHYPHSYSRKNTVHPGPPSSSQQLRPHSSDLSTRSKIQPSSYQAQEDGVAYRSKKHTRSFQGQYERPKHIQSLLKSTSVYDLVEPSTNTTRVFPSESSVQEQDLGYTRTYDRSPDIQESRLEDEIDLQKSKAHSILTGLFQCLKQTEEQMMATDTNQV